MRTLSRLGIVGLLAGGLLLVAGAAPGESAEPSVKAAVKVPAKVKAGQHIDLAVTCRPTDKTAHLHVKGAQVSVGSDISLNAGIANLSVQVSADAKVGDYHLSLTCTPSKAKASTTSTVIG